MQAAASGESTLVLRPEALATLPQELRRELSDALVSLDTARIGGIMRRVAELDPALGASLAHHAGQFAYTTIRQALQAGGDNSAKEAT